MNAKSLSLYFFCFLLSIRINSQIQIGIHFGAGSVSKKVENITSLTSGGQYIIPQSRNLVPDYSGYFESDITEEIVKMH